MHGWSKRSKAKMLLPEPGTRTCCTSLVRLRLQFKKMSPNRRSWHLSVFDVDQPPGEAVATACGRKSAKSTNLRTDKTSAFKLLLERRDSSAPSLWKPYSLEGTRPTVPFPQIELAIFFEALCVYTYIYIYTYVYIDIYTNKITCMHTCVYVHTHTCMSTHRWIDRWIDG